MIWTEVQIKTTPEAEEAISNIFYEAGIAGVVIESPNDLLILKNKEIIWDYYDESLIKVDSNLSIIKGYIDETEEAQEIIYEILSNIKKLPSYGIDPGSSELTITKVNQEDWANSWKKYYKPVKIGNHFIIKPTWENYFKSDDDIVIEIDPGMAFGSGLHETTQLCIENLEKYVKPGDVLIDIGCGSGILALAAGNLNCEKIIAVDLDSMAVKIAKENVENNNLQSIIEVREGDLLDVIHEEADVIIANILADVIINLSTQIRPFLKNNGVFISSGIILSKVDQVVESLRSTGFENIEVERLGEWAAVVARKKE
ncbi:50S ribosomal protein L11 methyltransferase [Alkalibaculum sp. M08DMB]|uniref:Ribosomal protein L11 methyltransferase n=1 Tax=Alkalibaculum sporogenes TaxID=2655001 RepID=A0A6A7KCC8_9FIRM|nr:50S ribosomal protein L11 methyltransferase [Alkalibaculum sporogenes]MPW27094.1 50S ribosomal protein L11 methyltransferase [Alkalibaculum sporogenes]